MTLFHPATAIQWRRHDGLCYCFDAVKRTQCRARITERVRVHFKLRARTTTQHREEVVTMADFYVCTSCADTLASLRWFVSRHSISQAKETSNG